MTAIYFKVIVSITLPFIVVLTQGNSDLRSEKDILSAKDFFITIEARAFLILMSVIKS